MTYHASSSPCLAASSQILEMIVLLLTHGQVYLTCTQATEVQEGDKTQQEGDLGKFLSSSQQEGDPSHIPHVPRH